MNKVRLVDSHSRLQTSSLDDIVAINYPSCGRYIWPDEALWWFECQLIKKSPEKRNVISSNRISHRGWRKEKWWYLWIERHVLSGSPEKQCLWWVGIMVSDSWWEDLQGSRLGIDAYLVHAFQSPEKKKLELTFWRKSTCMVGDVARSVLKIIDWHQKL